MKKLIAAAAFLFIIAVCFGACSSNSVAQHSELNSEMLSSAAETPDAAQTAQLEESSQTSPSNSPLKVGIRNDSPGFAYLNIDTGEISGFEVDIIKSVGALLERDIEFVVVNDTTREDALKSGEIDLIAATFTITDGRKEDYLFTRPYYTDRLAFLVPKESEAQTVADLDGVKVGVADDTTAVEDLESAAGSKGIFVEAVPYGTFTDAKKALFSGEIDALYMDESILRSYQYGRVIEEYFTPQPYGVAALKENAELLNAVDSAIDALTKDGTLEAFADHWELKLN